MDYSFSSEGIQWKKKPVIFAMGIRETGEYEIPGFYLFAKETHNSFFSVIQDHV